MYRYIGQAVLRIDRTPFNFPLMRGRENLLHHNPPKPIEMVKELRQDASFSRATEGFWISLSPLHPKRGERCRAS